MDLLHSGGEHDPIGGVTVAGEVAERRYEPCRHQPLRGVLGQVDTVAQGPRAGVIVVEPPHLQGAVHVVAVAEVAQHAEAPAKLREDGAYRRRASYVGRLPGVRGGEPFVLVEVAPADIVVGERRQRHEAEGLAGEREDDDGAVVLRVVPAAELPVEGAVREHRVQFDIHVQGAGHARAPARRRPPAGGVADGQHLTALRPVVRGWGDHDHLVLAGGLVEADPRAALDVGVAREARRQAEAAAGGRVAHGVGARAPLAQEDEAATGLVADDPRALVAGLVIAGGQAPSVRRRRRCEGELGGPLRRRQRLVALHEGGRGDEVLPGAADGAEPRERLGRQAQQHLSDDVVRQERRRPALLGHGLLLPSPDRLQPTD